jgi:hypothetical protein
MTGFLHLKDYAVFWPSSRVGWVGVVGASLACLFFGLNQIFSPLFATNDQWYAMLSIYEFTTFCVGMIGSTCALVAWVTQKDDAWAVRLSLFPLVIVIGGLVSLLWS